MHEVTLGVEREPAAAPAHAAPGEAGDEQNGGEAIPKAEQPSGETVGRSSARSAARAIIKRASSAISTISRTPPSCRENPSRPAATTVSARPCVMTEPPWPTGTTARIVRAQRSSCAHSAAKLGCSTRSSTR
jgi:hypothetical protein